MGEGIRAHAPRSGGFRGTGGGSRATESSHSSHPSTGASEHAHWAEGEAARCRARLPNEVAGLAPGSGSSPPPLRRCAGGSPWQAARRRANLWKRLAIGPGVAPRPHCTARFGGPSRFLRPPLFVQSSGTACLARNPSYTRAKRQAPSSGPNCAPLLSMQNDTPARHPGAGHQGRKPS